ncbi:MAG TPA: SNF2 helicase-associated domain-containing protein, partial [Flavisolibacter sp.]|nr:SNF2 helicase-associated domain-containing protein [Flavisolibacter sp.]
MLRTKSLTITVEKLERNLYAVRAIAHEVFFPVSDWRNMHFQHHRESYYGAFLDVKNEAVLLDGWQLATLFAHEKFNPFIEWDWDELAELCLTAAPSIYEAITEKDWLPDFTALEDGEFRWQLPKRVIEEFDISFWERGLGEETVQEFVGDWFHHALNDHLNQNRKMKTFLGDKLELLQKQSFPPGMLSAFFDEDTWLEWIGLKESNIPFTIGLRLDEPQFSAAVEESFGKLEAHDPSMSDPANWTLEIFLRDRQNPEKMVEVGSLPTKWRKYVDTIHDTEARWVRIFPWLKGISSAQAQDDLEERVGLKHVLSEEEAWEFLTEASETLLNLGVEILLPSWWEAMRNANLKVKARVKGTASSHRPSFVGLQAMLDFDWRFSMNGVDLSEDEFQQLVSEKRRLVYIRGRWVKLDPAFIRQIQTLMKQAEKEGLHVRDLIEQEMIAQEEEDQLENPKAFAKIQIELNRQWKTMIHQLSELKELPEVPVPDTLKAELRPYQQTGMNWLLFLRKYGFGAVLADDMGLGKTIQLISYLLSVKEQELKAGPALIVCPTSVLGNWQKELERFAPSLNVYLHYGPNRLKEEEFKSKAETSDV